MVRAIRQIIIKPGIGAIGALDQNLVTERQNHINRYLLNSKVHWISGFTKKYHLEVQAVTQSSR